MIPWIGKEMKRKKEKAEERNGYNSLSLEGRGVSNNFRILMNGMESKDCIILAVIVVMVNNIYCSCCFPYNQNFVPKEYLNLYRIITIWTGLISQILQLVQVLFLPCIDVH